MKGHADAAWKDCWSVEELDSTLPVCPADKQGVLDGYI